MELRISPARRAARLTSCALFVVPAFAFFNASCGGQTPGEKIRPKDQTYASAMGEGTPSGGACVEPEKGAEPLVVDWKPEQRGDLEVLMKDGVAVVSYTCKGFKLLKDCKVDGKYGFLGMTKKEQVVKLNNADEVKANLPLGGVGIAANIGAEMQRGATLDVAMIMIGKVKTSWGNVHVEDLKGEKGECDGATHFVKGAMVGAFVMQTGAKGEAKTAAQFFGAGASGGSASSKDVKNKDGDLSDCEKAAPDSPKAPAQCAALVRLELKGILPKSDAKADAKPAAGASATPAPTEKASTPDLKSAEVATATEVTCGKGLVMSDGKCTAQATAKSYLCKPSDGKECADQCGKGHAGSCASAGALYASGGGGLARDEVKARELLGKGCEGGEVKACTNLGLILHKGKNRDAAGAAKNFEKACNEGDALGCGYLGAALETGDGVTKDEAKGAQLLQKGCEGGFEGACGYIGGLLVEGRVVTKDTAKGTDYLKRACDGGINKSCLDLGDLYDGSSKDVAKNPIGAKIVYQRACFRGEPKGCTGQGRMELGFGGNAAMAKQAFEMACNRNDNFGCAVQKVLYGGTRVINVASPEAMSASTACNRGSMKDCAAAGTFQIAAGNKPQGMAMIERACMAQDPLACAVKKK